VYGLHVILFIFVVYLTTLSVAQTIFHRIIGWIMNSELERIRKEAVVAYFNLLSWYLPGGTEGNHSGSWPVFLLCSLWVNFLDWLKTCRLYGAEWQGAYKQKWQGRRQNIVAYFRVLAQYFTGKIKHIDKKQDGRFAGPDSKPESPELEAITPRRLICLMLQHHIFVHITTWIKYILDIFLDSINIPFIFFSESTTYL
jgi:hypothetical protein